MAGLDSNEGLSVGDAIPDCGAVWLGRLDCGDNVGVRDFREKLGGWQKTACHGQAEPVGRNARPVRSTVTSRAINRDEGLIGAAC